MSPSSVAIKDVRDSLNSYPKLSLFSNQNVYFIKGTWEVTFNNIVIEEYEIKIELSEKYPEELPLVFELSNKIPKKADRHINPKGNACLFVDDARWEIWPIGSSFLNFLTIPVSNFFLWQVYFAEYNQAPEWGERGHGEKGIIEYYLEKFELNQNRKALNLLSAVNNTGPLKRQCPCDSGKNLAECHGTIIDILKKNADKNRIRLAINIFQKHVSQEFFILNMKYYQFVKNIYSKKPFNLPT